MHRVDIEPPRRPGARPIRVGLAAGVHHEPTAVRVLHQVMTDAAAVKAGHVAYSFYPVVDPAAQARRKRTNDQGVDVNRTFLPGQWTPESRAMQRDLEGRRFDRFYDLHGSKEEGFFVIGGPGDERESARGDARATEVAPRRPGDPRRASPRWQQQGVRRLVDSLIHNAAAAGPTSRPPRARR